MVYTPLSSAPAGFLVTGAWMNLYLRDNLNALNGGGGLVSTGMILWWPSGLSIPDNWQLCDGTFGVIDLRDSMVVGAGTSYAVQAVGGALTAAAGAHTTHGISAPTHGDHVLSASAHPEIGSSTGPGGLAFMAPGAGAHGFGVSTGAHTHPGIALTDTHAHTGTPFAVTPPYMALSPIIKYTPTVAYPTPRTWSDGDVPTAAMFNQDLRDAINALRQRTAIGSQIMLWSGSLAALPSGYQLCDGSNSTPDLRDRFAISAGSSYAALATGGVASLTLPAHSNHSPTQPSAHGSHGLSMPTHASALSTIFAASGVSTHDDLGHANTTIGANHTAHSGFAVDAHAAHAALSTLPPYIALGYITLISPGTFTTPRTWSDGESVDQARLNTYLRDNEATLYNGQLPLGVIVVWQNSIASIPSGWSLCNGTGGTPETRDKFIMGAGLTYAVSATGGAASVTPAAHVAHVVTQPPAHSAHTVSGSAHASGAAAGSPGGAGQYSNFSHDWAIIDVGEHAHAFSLDGGAAHSAHDAMALLPPYMALAFIQRTS